MKTSLRGRSLFVRRQESGDTIVEVMIAMTILGLVLGAAFVTSRHSLQSGLQASYRDQAESYARQQIELIRELDASGSLAGYRDDRFCIDPSGPSKTVLSGSNTCTLPIGGTAGQYTVFDSYTGDSGASATKTYSVSVNWPSSTSNTTNQVTLYYKPRNSFISCADGGVSCTLTPPTSSTTTPLPSSWPYFSTNLGDSPTITAGQPLSLIWDTNPSAAYCRGSWVGTTLASSNMSPGYTVYPSTNTTYTLTCYDSLGLPHVSDPISVVVNTPPGVSLTATQRQLGLRWNSSGPIGGMYCTRLLETADPDTWNDNYLCAPSDIGLRWNSSGPIPGMYCIQLLEGADPYTWDDNYLCTPTDIGLRWNSSGPIPGMYCIQLLETADPDTWYDNFICEPKQVALSWTTTNSPDNCAASIDWTGSKNPSGGSEVLTKTGTNYSFKLTCTSSSGGSGYDTASVTLSTPSYISAPPPKVTFYEDANYNGADYQYSPTYDCRWVVDCGIPNDSISSIAVQNARVAVYQHIDYGGSCWNIDTSQNNLGGFNDFISSFKVGRRCGE